jgi:FO synthase
MAAVPHEEPSPAIPPAFELVAICLCSGANDLGGAPINESITRTAGAIHGEGMPPQAMEDLIGEWGRRMRRRTTLYCLADGDRTSRSFGA